VFSAYCKTHKTILFGDRDQFNPLSRACPTLLAAAVSPERGEHLLKNSILHFTFKLSQSSEIVLQIYTDEKLNFLKGGLALKGLNSPYLYRISEL